MSELEPIEYAIGAPIRDFDILEITSTQNGYEVLLDINLDSGFSLTGTRLELTHEDLMGYETTEVKDGVKYALGFFEEKS